MNEGIPQSDSSERSTTMSILETYAALAGLNWNDEWHEIADNSPRVGPIDWKQETFIYRYMNYLDEVAMNNRGRQVWRLLRFVEDL
jgi:hypothetical protein